MCAAATAGYDPCPGSNPQAITCPGGELIRSPNPHSDELRSDLHICQLGVGVSKF